MPRLLEIQTAIRDALVQQRTAAVVPWLVGGDRPIRRLAIHQRQYEASLTRAVVERFPATVWLIGSQPVVDAARTFVREHPPAKPCIAEYGEAFPRHLATHPSAPVVPYLAPFAELEWHLGRLALATDDSPNVHYVHLDWALDELIGLYLTDTAPDRFVLRREDVWLEVRGLRGEIRMARLTRDAFARQAPAAPTGATA
jgi:hypothetical protein